MMVRRSPSGEFEPVVKQRDESSQGHIQQNLVHLMNDARLPVETTKPSEIPPRQRPKNGKPQAKA